MKKLVVFSLISILPAFALMGCQRDRGVEAGYEQGQTGTYQPRPAAAAKGDAQQKANRDVKGELHRVDLAGKTMAVRVENGMEQTFKFDDNVVLTGIDGPMRNLVGKEGSEVTVHWKDHEGAKTATKIEVTQVVIAQPPPPSARRRR